MIPERPLEEAADELARLDAACAGAPNGIALALRLAAIARLGDVATPIDGPAEGTSGDFLEPPAALDALAAAAGDPLHDGTLPARHRAWRDLIDTEERRVRGGAPLALARFEPVAPATATYPAKAALEATWRAGDPPRAVLHRALASAAWAPDDAVGEASAALLLCAGGRTDRLRLLPFAAAPRGVRAEAITAWRAGDAGPWTIAALEALARGARTLRRAVHDAGRDLDAEWARLDALGRAASTARQALAHLRGAFVTTMPELAEELAISRPAAADALERLAAAGIVREVTGRARDRVYAWVAADAVARIPPA